MADKKKGYVPIYRTIQDNWIWNNDEPFDRRSAWIDLLLSANHKEEKILIRGQTHIIKPGQKWTSYKKLAEKWHWSYRRVLRYMKLLKSDGMIYTDGTPSGTLVTIVNWGNFAIRGKTGVTPNDIPNGTPPVTPDDTSDDTQTIMIKNVKNDKEVKKRKELPPLDLEEDWQ